MIRKVSRKNMRSSKSRRLRASRSKRSLRGKSRRRSVRPTRRNRSIRRRMRGGVVKTAVRTQEAATSICSAAGLTAGSMPFSDCIEEMQFYYDDVKAKDEAEKLASYKYK
jgi:hypothetical protein